MKKIILGVIASIVLCGCSQISSEDYRKAIVSVESEEFKNWLDKNGFEAGNH